LSEEDGIIQKRSKLRQEIEELLQKKGLVFEEGISAVNLDTGETHRFSGYTELQEFMKGRKGRWYITTPGLKHAEKDRRS
jgi:hypothetical protein